MTRVSRHQAPEGLLSSDGAGAGEQIHRFGECRPARDEWEDQLIERIHARSVVGLVGIDDRDEWTRVGEGHLLLRTSVRDSVNAAPVRRARPPPPWITFDVEAGLLSGPSVGSRGESKTKSFRRCSR